MPRTPLAVQTITKNTGATAAMTAADAANGMQFPNDGNTELLVQNGGGSSCTVTVHSVPDPQGRLGDLELTVAAAAIASVPQMDPILWNQQGSGVVGEVFLDFSEDTSVTVAAIRRG